VKWHEKKEDGVEVPLECSSRNKAMIQRTIRERGDGLKGFAS
jgi:hypothetical protein